MIITKWGSSIYSGNVVHFICTWIITGPFLCYVEKNPLKSQMLKEEENENEFFCQKVDVREIRIIDKWNVVKMNQYIIQKLTSL